MNNFNDTMSIEIVPIQWPTTVPKRIYNIAQHLQNRAPQITGKLQLDF